MASFTLGNLVERSFRNGLFNGRGVLRDNSSCFRGWGIRW